MEVSRAQDALRGLEVVGSLGFHEFRISRFLALRISRF